MAYTDPASSKRKRQNQKGKNMHLCFVVEGYPTPGDPFMTFIRELVCELTDRGMKCSVIAPQSLTRAWHHKVAVRPRVWQDTTAGGGKVDIYQPYYITVSSALPGIGRTGFLRAARKALKRIKDTPDALYGHFWHMGVVASKIHKTLPVFIACGESRIEVRDNYKADEIEALKKRLRGVVYVGTKSYCESKELNLAGDIPYIIAPNGYRTEFFHNTDRAACRKALGWPEEGFILSFVGSFNTRKGVDRLSAALSAVEGEPVYACFIGNGGTKPSCPNILFEGPVAHDDICNYIGASDVFVLPTNNEGCCNAIVEALGCGVPVISSDQTFNDDILDETCSIRIDPMDVEALKRAIEQLRDDKVLRERLAEGAAKKAEGLTIEARAARISAFLEECLRREK